MESVIKIYSKTAVNLTTKMGAFSFYLVNGSEVYKESRPFKKPCATLTQADCMAYVSALHSFSQMAGAETAKEIHIISDSGSVIDLLEVYKYQKHCDEVVAFWRDKVYPVFPKETKLIFKKISSKFYAGDPDSLYISRCASMATIELNKRIEIYK